MWTWGDNTVGELGNGAWAARDTPTQVTGLSNVVAVAAGKFYSYAEFALALDRAGRVWNWGAGGLLGRDNDAFDNQNTPGLVPGLSNITAIAAGSYHSLALRADGTVWAWGYNDVGQLGDNLATDFFRDNAAPVPGLTNVTAITAGNAVSFALDALGRVWSWGYNADGQLGLGHQEDQPQPVLVNALTHVTAITAGAYHILALRAEGTVLAWGNDGNAINSLTPVPVPGLSNIVLTAAGWDHSLFLDKNGRVWTWGNDDWNQLGDNRTNPPGRVFLVPGLSNVVSIAADWDYSIAATADGHLYHWGYFNNHYLPGIAGLDFFALYVSDGSGLPDLWQFKFFGYLGVDPNADPDGDGWSNLQEYQRGTDPTHFDTPPVVSGVTVTGNNPTPFTCLITWNAATPAPVSYTIYRADYDPLTWSSTAPKPIGSVAGKGGTPTLSFTDDGHIPGGNANSIYTVQAVYAGGAAPASPPGYVNGAAPPVLNPAHGVSAQLIRNETGRWQLAFAPLPPDAVSVLVDWCGYSYWYDLGPMSGWGAFDDWIYEETEIPARALTNGVYVVPDEQALDFITAGGGPVCYVRARHADGTAGNPALAGFIPTDAPGWMEGRAHLKQNLLFRLRAATLTQPYNLWISYWTDTMDYLYMGNWNNPANADSVESSLYRWQIADKGYGYYGDSLPPQYLALDNLWPFTAHYWMHQSLFDPNYTGPDTFAWPTNLVSPPAPAVLALPGDYWIAQDLSQFRDLGATTNGGYFTLASGLHNLFGLAFGTALVEAPGQWYLNLLGVWVYTGDQLSLSPGGSVPLSSVNCFYSQTAAPVLSPAGYYFSTVVTPGTLLVGLGGAPQPAPLPCLNGFAVTNQTSPLVAVAGVNTAVAAWAKFGLANGAANKFAYLGQYFQPAAWALNAAGQLATATNGVLSPYGNYFPAAPGLAAVITMPDLDTGAQGTNIVRVISLTVDANRDGVLDGGAWRGADFVTPENPWRFWINDNQDLGDDGGNGGIPGQPPGTADATTPNSYDNYNQPIYRIHGTRDLVDFFPVYVNIGSLFANTSWNTGINPADTNWQFTLSQADNALRFTTTTLTATNFMNYLLDTNTAIALGGLPPAYPAPALTTITNTGVALPRSFITGIATNRQGIILVEGIAATTQPLVLTVWHGTNPVAQAQLPLSITGVEQMFRHKNLLLNPAQAAKPDRLAAAAVPNEPVTASNNFVFIHGYNTNPNEARGTASDVFKRMFWAGSHARFWAVTWMGADTKVGSIATPNYHTNVYHAFQTAPLLHDFVLTLTNSGPVTVAAHSLGNMVTLSAISDWNMPFTQYFMIDAAVAMESIDPSVSATIPMVHPDWQTYNRRLWASSWYGLFPAGDGRQTLTWSNRLANVPVDKLYNFYSSGEEVLRQQNGAPPLVATAIFDQGVLDKIFGEDPVGTYTWVWQEKMKGTCPGNWLLGSCHGGWKFNPGYNPTYNTILSPALASALSDTQLRTNAFFDFAGYNGSTVDLALEGANGNLYAQTNRNRILSDAIPALTLPIGANSVPKLDAGSRNVDMQTLENNWPAGRPERKVGVVAAGEWWHSDFVNVAYTFTYKLFNQFVTLGNLK